MSAKEMIADRFASILRSWLSHREWHEMRRRNAKEANPSLCHSHDFRDANMAMHQAFEECDLGPLVNADKMADETCELWNAAWAVAFVKHLGGQQP